jgi:hypothetical protein
MKVLALVALAGCNRLLDLAPTTEIDGQPPPPGVIVPPDGPTNCPPAPDFSTWSFSQRTLPGFTQPMQNPSFVAADRVIFASQGQLFESGLDGGATPITSLDLPDDSTLGDPSPAPGGDVFWFTRVGGSQAGLYYAVRDDAGWTPHRADFGVSAVNLTIGAAAFYAGSIRMPAVRTTEPTMIELQSFDGTTWTLLQTIQEDGGGAPTFSADGCLMLYTYAKPAASGFAIAVAARNADGTFGPGTPITQATNSAATAAIDPTYRRVWMVDDYLKLVEGLAP